MIDNVHHLDAQPLRCHLAWSQDVLLPLLDNLYHRWLMHLQPMDSGSATCGLAFLCFRLLSLKSRYEALDPSLLNVYRGKSVHRHTGEQTLLGRL